MGKLKFGEPPGKHRVQQTFDHRAVAEELKAVPNQWAQVPFESNNARGQGARYLAWLIRHGRTVAFRPIGSFEATSRRNKETGEIELWVRYVGKKPVTRKRK